MASADSSVPDVETIAQGYLRYSASLASENFDPDSIWDPEHNPDDRAYSIVNDAVLNGPPERAWEIVTTLLRLSPDDRLGLHAAGPLEDMVRRWGTELVARIENLAAADERFRWALGGIWLTRTGRLQAAIVERIVAASDGSIKLL